MGILPWPLALTILMVIAVIATGAYLYWDKEPVKAQRIAVRMIAPFWKFAKAAFVSVRWVVATVIALGCTIALVPVYTFIALAWVLMKRVVGEPTRITIKLT